MTALLKYDVACRAIAEARSFDDVRDWEDKAAAVREYARRANNRTMEIDALEIRERARRRRGQLLTELRLAGLLHEGKPKENVTGQVQLAGRMTLEELNTTRNESSRDQKLAALDGNSFERLLARCRDYMAEHPEKHTMDVLRAKDGPINGARSVMGSRIEPDDSLDYFPTPPWATRALIEKVLRPHLGTEPLRSAWEPACGEGHIAEVLTEYFDNVAATDIHAYGYGAGDEDFLKSKIGCPADWIVTNPPFGDMTEPFVLRALDLARVGIAMFVRLQWLESVGRYEAIFRDNPPTIIAFFAERVPLCKGRWDPEGSTATAYIWLVWAKGTEPRAPLWIPPGCRDALTHPDDAIRFTTNPVTKKIHCDEPFNPATGEIERVE